MNKFCLVVFVLAALGLHVSAQSDVARARWKTAAITIDGNDNEWKKPLNLYDAKSGLVYSIANDKNMLYLDFEAGDRLKMRKLMVAGWSLDLISKEKGNKFKASIIFPEVRLSGVRDRRSSEQPERGDWNNQSVKGYEMNLQKIGLKGFRSNQTEVPLRNKSGIDIAVGENDQNELVYEIAIPLKDLFVENTIHLNEALTLIVNVNGLSRPTEGRNSGGEFGSGMNRGGGRMGGGMRGGGGGRMGSGGSGFSGGEIRGMEGGSRGGEGMGDRSAMFEKTSFKQKFKLTDN